MAETKFTKGEWRISRPDPIECLAVNAWCIESYSESGAYRGSVASSQSAAHIGGIVNEEGEANLHLLFAAPALYEALKELTAWFPSKHDDWHTDAPHKALEAARAALALAEGKQ